jgi:hypothetical protein
MDEKNKIDDYPSLSLLVEYQGKKSCFRLSSLYGSYLIESEVEIPLGEIMRFFCPACKKEFVGNRVCDVCKAPMIPIMNEKGGWLQICARRGCKKHLVEFEDLEEELVEFYNIFNVADRS